MMLQLNYTGKLFWNKHIFKLLYKTTFPIILPAAIKALGEALTSRWSCGPAGWCRWSGSASERRPPATGSCLCTERTSLRRRCLRPPPPTETQDKCTWTKWRCCSRSSGWFTVSLRGYLDVEAAAVRSQASAFEGGRPQLSVSDLQGLQAQRRTLWHHQHRFNPSLKMIMWWEAGQVEGFG